MSIALPITRIQPVAYYPLFTGSLRDHSANSNHASPVGSVRWEKRDGTRGVVGGSAGHLVIPHSTTLDPGSSFSIFARVDIRDNPSSSIIDKATFGGASTAFAFYTQINEKLALYDGVNQSTSLVVTPEVATACVTWTSGVLTSFYVDGAFSSVGSKLTNATAAAVAAHIGGSVLFSGNDAYNPISVVALFPGVLTPREVATMHEWAMDIISLEPVRDRRYFQSPRVRSGHPDDVLALDFGRANLGVVQDQSGGATAVHQATATGNVGSVEAPGGRGLGMTGVTGAIAVPHHADFVFGDSLVDQPFSMEIAFRFTEDKSTIGLMSKGVQYGTDQDWQFLWLSGSIIFATIDQNPTKTARGRKTPNTVTAGLLGSVVHVVVTYNGDATNAGHKVYVNGEQMDDADYAGAAAYVAMEGRTGELAIGYYNTAATIGNGQFFMARIQQGEISAGEAKALAAPWNRRQHYYEDFAWAPTSLATLTAGTIPGTDFEIISGSFKISEDANGKRLECVGAGIIARDHHTAVGTWRVKVAPGAGTPYCYLVPKKAAWNTAGQDGYMFAASGADGKVRMWGLVNGAATLLTGAVFTGATPYQIDVTRNALGVWTVYENDAAIAASEGVPGTNPLTEATYTDLKYQCFDLDAGDKVYLTEQFNGVVAP